MVKLLLFIFLCGYSSAAEIDQAVRRLSTDKKEAVRQLKKLARSRDELVKIRALVALGPHCSKTDLPGFTKLIKKYRNANAKNLAYPRIEGHVENARLLARGGDLVTALHILDEAGDKAKEQLSKAVVLEASGDCVRIPNKRDQALEYYKKALATGDRHFRREKISKSGSELKPAKPGHQHWGRVKKRIQRKIRQIEQEIQLAKYGLDYGLYESARKAQRAGAYHEAFEKYTILDQNCGKSIYAEAGRFYRCLCLPHIYPDRGPKPTKSMQIKKTIKALQAFYDKNPGGLYRGECLYEMGRLTLTELWKVDDAAKYFDKAVKWCQSTRRSDRALELYTIPRKSQKISMPPKDNQYRRGGVIIEQVKIEPGKLINRQTAKWYLNQIEKQSRYGIIFTLFVNNKWDEAKKVLDPVLDLDPHLKWAQSNECTSTFFRYELSIKLRKLGLNDHEMSRVSKTYRCRVMWAQFLFLQRRAPEAKVISEKVLKEAERARDRATQAVALLVLADSLSALGKRTLCQNCIERAARDFRDQPVAGRALFQLGNIRSRPVTKKTVAENLHLYKEAQKAYPNSYISRNADTTIVFLLATVGEYGKAQKHADGLKGEAKEIALKKIQRCRQFDQIIKELEQQ